jgi:hypothetical protein
VTSAQVLSDVVPQNDIRAPQELASQWMFAPHSGPTLTSRNLVLLGLGA